MASALALRTSHVAVRAPATAFEPNVIPFIDILLVLIIIFMVTAPLPTVDIKVDLPQGDPAPAPERPTIVGVYEDGGMLRVSVDGESVDLSQLGARTIARAQFNNPDTPVRELYAQARIFVRAEQSVAYGNVVLVMDALQAEGFAKVGIFAELAEP